MISNDKHSKSFEIDSELAEFLDQRPLPESIQSLNLSEKASEYAKLFHESAVKFYGEKERITDKIVQLTQKIRLVFQNEVEILLSPLDGLSDLPGVGARSVESSYEKTEDEKRSCVRLKGEHYVAQLEIVGNEQEPEMTFILSLLDKKGNSLPSFRYTLGAKGYGVHPNHDRRLSESHSVELGNLEPAHYTIRLEPIDGSEQIDFEL